MKILAGVMLLAAAVIYFCVHRQDDLDLRYLEAKDEEDKFSGGGAA